MAYENISRPGDNLQLYRPIRPKQSFQNRRAIIYVLVENNVKVNEEVNKNINIAIAKWISNIQEIVHDLNDEYYIRVLPVNSSSAWMNSVMDIQQFIWQDLPLEGKAVSNVAFDLLYEELKKCESNRWNYMRPTIIYFSSTRPERDCKNEFDLLENTMWGRANRIAISVGTETDMLFLKRISNDNVIITREKFDLILEELWNVSCCMPSILFSNEHNHKRLVELEINKLYEGIFRFTDSTSTFIGQADNIGENVVLDDVHILRKIIVEYGEVWENPKKSKALFMDFFPDNKPLQHVLLSCINISIPVETKKLEFCSRNQYHRFVKRLTNEFGYLDELAGKAVSAWMDAFGVKVGEPPAAKSVDHEMKMRPIKNIDDISMDELGLSVRSYNEFRRRGINTLGDLRRRDSKEGMMGNLPLGRKSLEELIGKLKKMGINPAVLAESEDSEAEQNHPGKEKCDKLRAIRKKIADANGIDFEPVECHHTGPCLGTCPACDAEIKYLDEEIQKKRKRGEPIILAGLAEDEIVQSGCQVDSGEGCVINILDGILDDITDDELASLGEDDNDWGEWD